MKDETRERTNELLDTLEDEVEVTGFEINEYIRGDPTTDDATVTGAQIEIVCYLSLDDEDDDQNPYRLK